VNFPPTNISGNGPNTVIPETVSKLIRVSSMPIAGFTVFSKERIKVMPTVQQTPTTDTSTTQNTPAVISKQKTTKVAPLLTEFMPALRYVDRATGNIYETFADKISEQKFSGTVIPKVYESFFGNSGQSVVMRYLKTDARTIETFVGNLPKELLGADPTVINDVKGSFLAENIKDASLSPDTANIFYLLNVGDNIIGTIASLTTSKKIQVFSSPFTEWLSQWPTSSMITLTTKPASGIPGYMYAINPNTKSFTSVFGGINGLTTLTSPNGKLVLYGDDTLTLNVYHTDTKISDLVGVKTMPEKCVWGKLSDRLYCAVPKSTSLGSYPDSWYQGEVSFNDQIWKVDLKTGNTILLIDPAIVSGAGEVDGIKLMLDTGENYLFFVNKKNSYLWELALK
jgi:hypothetical protein